MSNHRDTSFELRDSLLFSGSDHFMSGGHQIINSNRANAGAKRKDAKWARSDKTVRQLLLRVFPKLATNEKQRRRAGRWSRVIQLFYRSGMSYGDIAAEMGEKATVIKRLLQGIRRAANGQSVRVSGKARKRIDDRMSLEKL